MTVDEMTAKRDALLDSRAKAVRTVEFEGRRVSPTDRQSYPRRTRRQKNMPPSTNSPRRIAERH